MFSHFASVKVAQPPTSNLREIFPPSYLFGDARPEHLKGKGDTSQLQATSWPPKPPRGQRSLQQFLCRICLDHLTPPERSWQTCRISDSQGFVTTTTTTTPALRP